MKTDFKCPICNETLDFCRGDQLQKERGFTLYCANRGCEAMEVMGYGSTLDKAYDIILEKMKSSRKNNK